MDVKFRAGKYLVKGTVEFGNKMVLRFPYNPELIEHVKALDGSKYNGFSDGEATGDRSWSVPVNEHNVFQLEWLIGKNPYKTYDDALLELEDVSDIKSSRDLFNHQKKMIKHGLLCHYCIWAAEMGTGKTLAAIELMERVGGSWFWIGPKSAIEAVKREFRKWKAKIQPQFYTYDNLRKILEGWPKDLKPPQGIIFDEASRINNPEAKRSQGAAHIAEAIRREWGPKGFVILMSGSPSPKNPAGWFGLVKVARPGYLREGTLIKFKKRLGLVKLEESVSGGQYNKLVTWFDNEWKCKICGGMENISCHTDPLNSDYHPYLKSINEISYLSKRLNGLVLTLFKKDCLNLPEKNYQLIKCQPNRMIQNFFSLIKRKAKTVIEALTLCRELSDGFQYQETGTLELPCPKDEALEEILEDHLEVGRLVIYAGFTASVDRVERICQKNGWKTIKVDGRGWICSELGIKTSQEMLDLFQESSIGPVAFIGQASAAGLGLTLTASPSIVYWSNDFHPESRIQSEDRIHRPGCRGANIFDLIHLPTDSFVLENLKKSRSLQALTLNDVWNYQDNLSVD